MMLYQNLLDTITDKCRQIFGADLIGVYLHGSMAMGCFHPQKSDIDLIIVVRNPITDQQKLRFMNHIVACNQMAPEKGIELSIVRKEVCIKFNYPTPFELHFSNTHLPWFLANPADYIRKMIGTDKDLAAHFTIIKKYGIVLWGAAVDDVFADVPKGDYIDSILYDVENAGEDVLKNPAYVILNLCRTAAFLTDDLILSKKQGGEWALQNLPEQYHSLISNAIQCYISGNDMCVNSLEARSFVDSLMQRIRALSSCE